MSIINYKKYLLFFLLFFSFIYSYDKPFAVKAKLSNFTYQDKTARKLFDDNDMLFSIEGLYKIYKLEKINFDLFIEAGFLYDKGFDEKTLTILKLFLSPISFGINTNFIINDFFSIYLKTAPNWIYAKLKHNYPAPPNKTSKNTFGATFGIGCLIQLKDRYLFDLFFNYLYDSKKIKDNTSDLSFKLHLGGFQIGYGFGVKF
jgi:hypothetical protein